MLAFNLAVLAFAAFSGVRAQVTVSTTDALGDTIIEVETTDVNGLPITTAVQTIAPTSTSAASSTASTLSTPTTTTPEQVGPVGESPTAVNGDPHGPTPYTFQTTDAAGNTIKVTSTFIPSFATPATTPVIPTTGTVLAYSDWLALVGTATSVPAGGAPASRSAAAISARAWSAGTVLMGVALGALAVLA